MSDAMMMDLFSQDIESLADLPTFKPKPTGSYLAKFNYEVVTPDEEGANPFLKFEFILQDILELKDETRRDEVKFDGDKPPRLVFTAFPFKKDGDKSEYGEGILKIVTAGLKEINPGNNIGEILENNQGATVAITIKESKRKDRDTKEIKEQNDLVALNGAE